MTTKLVLVADDDEDTVAAYEVLLRSHGLAVEAASDGPGALYKTLELRPDILLLDLGLPLMGGLEVLRRLRAEGIARIPVLILTGQASPEAAAAAIREGADDVMVKPCDPLALCARVQMLLQTAAAPTSANEPRAGDEPSSGSIRLPRPRRAAAAAPRTRASDEWTTPSLTQQLSWTATSLQWRASLLRDQSAWLRACARGLRASARGLRSGARLPWRGNSSNRAFSG